VLRTWLATVELMACWKVTDKIFSILFLFKDLFIWEKERETAQAGGAEGKGERISSRLHTQHGARRRTQSHDPEIMTQTETKSQSLNQLQHPGAPIFCFLILREFSGSIYSASFWVQKFLWLTKNNSRDGKQWSMAQVWPSTCFWTAHKLRVFAYIFKCLWWGE